MAVSINQAFGIVHVGIGRAENRRDRFLRLTRDEGPPFAIALLGSSQRQVVMLQARRQDEILMSLEVRMPTVNSGGDYRHDNPRSFRAGFSRGARRIDRVNHSSDHDGDYTPQLTERLRLPR